MATWCRPAKAGPTTPTAAEIADGKPFTAAPLPVSKERLSTFTFAVRALEAVAARQGAVELHFTYDEEFGGEARPRLGCCKRA